MSGSRPSSALGYPYPTRPLYPWASPNPCPQAEGPFEPWLGCLTPVPWTPPSVHPRSPAEPHAGALRARPERGGWGLIGWDGGASRRVVKPDLEVPCGPQLPGGNIAAPAFVTKQT